MTRPRRPDDDRDSPREVSTPFASSVSGSSVMPMGPYDLDGHNQQASETNQARSETGGSGDR